LVIKMNYEEYCELYGKILAKTMDKEAAIAILQEIGKDNRTPNREYPIENKEPATEKQKNLMKKMKIPFDDNTTKKSASMAIDARMGKK
jgi:hypothetical protein